MKIIVPRGKEDYEAIENLKKASLEEMMVHIDGLLEILDDINWPVSIHVAEVLNKYTNSFKVQIIKILKGYDSNWKYYVIRLLIYESKENKIDKELLDELRRLVDSPTDDDKQSDVDLEAKEALDFWAHAN